MSEDCESYGYDGTVAVRIPVQFDSGAAMAGWIERAICDAMERSGWVGGCAVFFDGEDGQLKGYRDGEGIWDASPAAIGNLLLAAGGRESMGDKTNNLKGAVVALAGMVATIAVRCWENLGTDTSREVAERCQRIVEDLEAFERLDEGR